MWFSIPSYLFEMVGGIDFLLKCDFDPPKLPLKLSDYHKQVLLYWKMLHKHNFSPYSATIWNNRYILHKKKSLFYKDWMDKGVWAIVHLMDSNGTILEYKCFKSKFNLDCNLKTYSIVTKAIPTTMINMVKASLQYSSVIPALPTLFIGNYNILDIKCNNLNLRSTLTTECFPLPVRRKVFCSNMSKKECAIIRCRYLSFPLLPKMKEVHFKTLNDIYPCLEFLRIRFKLENNLCTFCQREIETQEHLFYDCTVVKNCWDDLHSWLATKNRIPMFDYNSIKVGVFAENKSVQYMCNNMLIMCKYYIHKCRFFKVNPNFIAFKNELFSFCKSLKKLECKSSLKLMDQMSLYLD